MQKAGPFQQLMSTIFTDYSAVKITLSYNISLILKLHKTY